MRRAAKSSSPCNHTVVQSRSCAELTFLKWIRLSQFPSAMHLLPRGCKGRHGQESTAGNQSGKSRAFFCGGSLSLSLLEIIMRNTACSKDLAAHLPPCPKKVEMTKRES